MAEESLIEESERLKIEARNGERGGFPVIGKILRLEQSISSFGDDLNAMKANFDGKEKHDGLQKDAIQQVATHEATANDM